MITVNNLKKLAAVPRRNNPIIVAAAGENAQLHNSIFVFELPLNEVLDDALTKYGGEPLGFDWRKDTNYVSAAPGIVAQAAPESIEVEEEDEGLLHLVKLSASEPEIVRYVQASLYEFFSDQLMNPVFKVHPGNQDNGEPSCVTVWEGDKLVGTVGPFKPDDPKMKNVG